MIRSKWKWVITIYLLMLAAYFIHPLGRILPAWCLWDIYIALVTIFLSRSMLQSALERRRDVKALSVVLAISAFIGVEADVLTRIFLFIPLGLYSLMGVPEEALPMIWIAGAIQTPIESAVSVVTTIIIGVPLLLTLEKAGILKWPLT